MKSYKNCAWAEEISYDEIQEMCGNFEIEKEVLLDKAILAVNKFSHRESQRCKEPKIKKTNQCWN